MTALTPKASELRKADDKLTDAQACYVQNVEINAAMVDRGWALAFTKYSDRYVPNENGARVSQLGLWSGIIRKALGMAFGRSRSRTAIQIVCLPLRQAQGSPPNVCFWHLADR